jgi:sulfate transport system substrate-binding protein
LKNQILGGAPVQVAVLSSELYLDQLKEKGFITSDWRKNPNKGSAIQSVVVFVTRKGNPKGLGSFQDLAKPGTKVLHANPDTSGGAQWAIFAIYGAGANLANLTYGPGDEGVKLLSAVGKNVIAQPESARQTFVQFDAGFGDAIVTYENEALLEKAKGREYEIVVPRKTIVTEWKVARIDKNISPEQEHAVAELIRFLYTAEAQRAYAKYGFRSVDAGVGKEFQVKYAHVAEPFTVDDLGGWQSARKNVIENAWKKSQQK